MKLKRTFISIVALMLAVCLMPTALAATWYLEDGDITVIADENGQSVKQGNNDAVADDDIVITQRDSEKATDNTITVSTTDDATANITIEDVNINSDGDAIDVGSSGANITLEGDNKLNSEYGSAIHVSDGDVTITGSGSLEAEIQDNDGYDYNHNAKIGSHENEDMSGTIHITGDATVKTDDKAAQNLAGDGAGIGSGEEGEMSGKIIIDGNAHVEVSSNDRGAGIGSGDEGNLSGEIIIGGNAHVSAIGAENSAGIGSGDEGDFTGSITIDGNANVTAKAGGDQNGYDGSGIGAGDDGRFTGTVTIGGNATVVAAGSDEGCGIGNSDGMSMGGTIIIQDNAKVTAYGGNHGAAIGAERRNDMTGKIIIVGNATIYTGVVDDEGNIISDCIGYIGDSKYSNHESDNGHYIIGPDVTINGISGSDIEALKDYINMRLSGENHDGEPENLTKLDVRSENGEFTVTAEGEGTVEKILYGGSETVPTAPGKYPVTCVIRIGEETIEFQIGTYVVPEPAPQPVPMAYHTRIQLYRVADKQGRSIAYKAVQQGGVLTVTTDEKEARLIIERGGLFALSRQGITKIVFVTAAHKSVINVSAAMEKGSGEFVLLHSSRKVKLIIAGAAVDADGILIKE